MMVTVDIIDSVVSTSVSFPTFTLTEPTVNYNQVITTTITQI